MKRIEDWSIVSDNPYAPPELSRIYIKGKIYGCSVRSDGTPIATSHIQKVNGKTIETRSGSIYELGKPNTEYVEWCKDMGCHIPTDEEPIKSKNNA